jgi:hypothetical protein
LIDSLKGAKVRLEGPSTAIIDGTLAGTQEFRGQTLHGFLEHYQIIVRTDDGETRTAVPYKNFVIAKDYRSPTRPATTLGAFSQT